MAPASLQQLIPSTEMLLSLEDDRLAAILLRVAKENRHNEMFQPALFNEAIEKLAEGAVKETGNPYAAHSKRQEMERAVGEALNWLRSRNLITQAPDYNGTIGWLVITRKGEKFDEGDIDVVRRLAAFPRDRVHPVIAEAAWAKMLRGDFDDAVLASLKAVEEAVREAGGFSADLVGLPLVWKAFDKDSGPLTDMNEPEGERKCLGHLFAGAIGYYKNPQSHRTVKMELEETEEVILLASHLMRIVDRRREMRKAASP